FPRHPGREMRHCGRGRPVPGGRARGGNRARRASAALPHQRGRLGRLRPRPCAALRAGAGDRRPQALSACAARPLGQGDARSVLRSGRARRGARHRRRAHVRRRFRGRVLRHGAGRQLAGSGLMDVALPTGEAVASRDFFLRARERLTLEVPPALNDPGAQGKRGDLDLDPSLWERAGVTATRPAAVLIPVVDRAEPQVLLTQRTELPSHPGQIAFPGGKIEPSDATPVAAGLREAQEEIGLTPALIEPIGYLDLYLTFSGFRVLPTLARVAPDYRLTLNAAEVADAFEV